VGAFDDYYLPILAPDSVSGAFDPTDVKAIALFHNGGNFPILDVRVAAFDITCIPEPGTWLAMGGLIGLAGFSWMRSRASRAQ
jgi:hypothetical protein